MGLLSQVQSLTFRFNAEKKLAPTARFRGIPDRQDIDVVIVATSDQWHSRRPRALRAKMMGIDASRSIRG
jgi:hypothetical protein